MNISAIVLGKIKVGVDQAKLAFAGRQEISLPGAVLYKITEQPSVSSGACGESGIQFGVVPVKYIINGLLGSVHEVSDFIRLDGKW